MTSDHGASWHTWPIEQTWAKGVDFIDAQTGWRIVGDLETGYKLERTEDSGQSWQVVTTLTWFGDLDFVNERTGWAIARKDNRLVLQCTTDGGITWKELHPIE